MYICTINYIDLLCKYNFINMRNLSATLKYIHETLGIQLSATALAENRLGSVPIVIQSIYTLYQSNLFDTDIILAVMNNEELSIHQTKKQLQLIKKLLGKKVILVVDQVQAYNRKRLIENGINFIVPGKQLYLPDMLVDLREHFLHPKLRPKSTLLLPSAQFLLMYHLLHRSSEWSLEKHSFKEIAKKFGYTPMAITNAVNNLEFHKLINVLGEKTKFIQFKYENGALWNIVHQNNLLVNPVIKIVYVNELPPNLELTKSNVSALSWYTDLDEGEQTFYALEKTAFYNLSKKNILVNPNNSEGPIALEVWKYDPAKIIKESSYNSEAVDPLSLYLSLKDLKDERIQVALDQLLNAIVWLKD